MIKQYEIIHLNNFMYVVDKAIAKWEKPILGNKQLAYHGKETVRYANIIASNDPSLNLPLLPNIEEDVEQVALNWYKEKYYVQTLGEHHKEFPQVKGFIEGYKAASKKKYTDEQVRNLLITATK